MLGSGLGDSFEHEAFGEAARGRGPRLDEALTLLTPLRGDDPVWVGGYWPDRAPSTVDDLVAIGAQTPASYTFRKRGTA